MKEAIEETLFDLILIFIYVYAMCLTSFAYMNLMLKEEYKYLN